MSKKHASLAISLLILVSAALAQTVDPAQFSDLHWRMVGPFRGGRALSGTGVVGDPSTWYFGSVGGGVWKTTDAGMTWEPIFDKEPIASIGAVAVAPSDPNVVYAGSGEADMRDDISYGAGLYKSTDAGRTWNFIGLKDSRQIGKIIVDPKNADTVYVASLGHAYGANAERGVFKTTDGGKSWNKVLFKDENSGAIDIAFDPSDSNTIYAALWQTRRPPWNVYPPSNGPGSGLYKSTDAGATWKQLTNGLPVENLGRMGIAISAADPKRIYLVVDAKEGGIYRSDDAGETFTLADKEARVWGRGWYFGIIAADPKNADNVFVANTSTYKSTDGGHNFVAFKGAPGGDDYHGIWISPDDSNRIIISSDQGTIITLNGGKTWSSWYNQPTAQIYHVVTDNKFPYWIYGAQQDSGAVTVPSRSRWASLTERDFRPIGVGGESGSIAVDPKDSNIIYGGTVSKLNFTTWEDQNISPTLGREGNFRTIWTLPLTASQADKNKLYFSHQMLFRTSNGGNTWDQISPDLTREDPGVPANLDPITAKYGLASPRKGVIYAIAPSPIDANTVWIGTDDGLVQLTRDDGKTWQNVTPKELTPWSKVGIIDASHFDKNTAYAAVDRHRLEDIKPYIYRTRDGGKTWQMTANGIPEGAYVNAVREDLERKGLLFAGTELGIYVSFNDGDNWQPLQFNLPVASVRDIAVRHDDLVIATHGRSFWVLDDMEPLREAGAKISSQNAFLFQPEVAYRVRPGGDQGTPYPPEIAHADNAPNGVAIDYYLKSASSSPVTLEVLDGSGNLVRRYSSDERSPKVDEKTLDIPMYWIKPTPVLSADAGMHRFLWDLHYASATAAGARAGRRGGSGPWVVPGQYTVKLTVDGKSLSAPLTVKMDPRINVTQADLQSQLAASQKASETSTELGRSVAQAASISRQLRDARAKAKDNAAIIAALDKFEQRMTELAGKEQTGFGAGAVETISTDETSLRRLSGIAGQVLGALQSADTAPTADQLAALDRVQKAAATTTAQWQQFVSQDLPALNSQLHSANLPEISAEQRGGGGRAGAAASEPTDTDDNDSK